VPAKAVASIVACAIALAAAGCGRENGDTTATAPTRLQSSPAPAPVPVPAPIPVPLPAPQPAPLPIGLVSIAVAPTAVFGNSVAVGTAMLNRPAPSGGIPLALSSSLPTIASVPSLVMIPEGGDRVTFQIAVQSVAADDQARISGSATDTSASAVLQLWSKPPTFFSFVSDAGDYIGGGEVRRVTPAETPFRAAAALDGRYVEVATAGPDNWSLVFMSPGGTRLGVGSYEGALRAGATDRTRPGIDISGRSRGCNRIAGRFDVRDISIGSDGVVSRFHATYEQHCEAGTPALRGEVRFIR